MIAATFCTTPVRFDSRGGIHETRSHLWDVDTFPTAHDSRYGCDVTVSPGAALCGRDGELASIWGTEGTERIVAWAQAHQDHYVCRQCLRKLGVV